MGAHSLREWGDVLVAADWTVEREIDTLVTLARSGDAAVALRAIEALHGILREVLDPEVQQQLHRRFEIERRNRSSAAVSRLHRESDLKTN